jgi:hypothetical protein
LEITKAERCEEKVQDAIKARAFTVQFSTRASVTRDQTELLRGKLQQARAETNALRVRLKDEIREQCRQSALPAAAILAQALWRGRAVRIRRVKVCAAIVLLQARWRGKLARDTYVKTRIAILVIQSARRGKPIRAAYLKMRAAANTIKRAWRTHTYTRPTGFVEYARSTRFFDRAYGMHLLEQSGRFADQSREIVCRTSGSGNGEDTKMAGNLPKSTHASRWLPRMVAPRMAATKLKGNVVGMLKKMVKKVRREKKEVRLDETPPRPPAKKYNHDVARSAARSISFTPIRVELPNFNTFITDDGDDMADFEEQNFMAEATQLVNRVQLPTTITNVMSYKAKNREKRKETLQIHRHAPMHVSECTQLPASHKKAAAADSNEVLGGTALKISDSIDRAISELTEHSMYQMKGIRAMMTGELGCYMDAPKDVRSKNLGPEPNKLVEPTRTLRSGKGHTIRVFNYYADV